MYKGYHIPKFIHAFFKWYCRKERYEELHGDLEEFYYERVEELGRTRATALYFWDVIRCCQPYAWKDIEGQNSNYIMFKNYFKTSMRSLMKNPLSSFINVFGLSMAIGICLMAYGFLEWEYNLDQFHENKNEVYLATFYADREGKVQQYGLSPTPLAGMLKSDYAQIKKVCRIEDRRAVVKKGDKVFYQQVRYTDPEFLEMFTFPLKWGSPTSLRDMNSIILSENMSIKYFGETNPIGKDILIAFDEERKKTFTVAGVAMPFPRKHAIEFEMLINFENFKISDPEYNLNDWAGFVNGTLIQVNQESDITPIAAGMEKYRQLQNASDSDWEITSYEFIQLAELSRASRDIRNDISFQYPPQKYVLAVFSALLLILACLNYINIAIGSAARRLKEIGLRKTIGASKTQVMVQFLAENIFVTFFALVIGVMLSVTIINPTFNQVFDGEVSLEFIDPALWLFLLLTLLFTGLVSGLYPALYVSKFRIVKIFRGSVQFGKKNTLTKMFLASQLVLTCMCLTCGIALTLNTIYIGQRSWGYNKEVTIYANLDDYSAFSQLHGVMSQNPNVIAMAGSQHHLGREISNNIIELPDRDYNVRRLSVDADYFQTMGLNLLEGRGFADHRESDKQAIVVNQTLIENLDLTDPIGHQFKIDSTQYDIVGVVADFHIYSFEDEIQPTIFRVADREDIRYLSLKVRRGSEKDTYDALQEEWAALFPEIPFRGGYQSEVLGPYVEEAKDGAAFIMSLALIAIILISLGFYGLVSLNISGRVREFSIKKALGARFKNIASNIYSQYAKLMILGLLVGMPISYVTNEAFLDLLYHYHMPMTLTPISIAALIVVTVLLSVVIIQVFRVVKSNPVDGLRVE